MKTERIRHLAGASTVLCLVVSPFANATAIDLKKTYYDYGVAVYCSLANATVAAGFERELKRIIARDALDGEQIRRARMDGWTEVELEWDNRGLGGFRGWCKTEGKAAAERFLAVPE